MPQGLNYAAVASDVTSVPRWHRSIRKWWMVFICL